MERPPLRSGYRISNPKSRLQRRVLEPSQTENRKHFRCPQIANWFWRPSTRKVIDHGRHKSHSRRAQKGRWRRVFQPLRLQFVVLLQGRARRKRPGQRNWIICCMLRKTRGGRPAEQLLSSLQPKRQLRWRLRHRRGLRRELQRRSWDEKAQLEDFTQAREHAWVEKRFREDLRQPWRRTWWFHRHPIKNNQSLLAGQLAQAFERPASSKGWAIRR